MTDPRIEAFLSGGGTINKLAPGQSGLDPITGMSKKKLKLYLNSRNNGAKASPKLGRPRKHCKNPENNTIFTQYR